MARRSTQQTKSRKTGPADSIAEGKLARVELIAREALDILGEESPESLRKAHGKVVAEYDEQVTNLEHRLKGAAEQIKSVEGELRHSTRLASDRLEEAERVWDVASEQAQELKTNKSELEKTLAENKSQVDKITELKLDIQQASEATSKLRDELRTQQSDTESARKRFEKDIKNAHAKATKLETLAEELQAQLDTMAEQHSAQATSMTELSSSLAAATDARDEALNQAENTQSQLAQSRDELAEKSARLSESHAAVTIAREQLAEVETRADENETQAIELAERNQSLTSAMQGLELSEAETRFEIAKAHDEIAEFSGRLADRDQTISRLSQQVAERSPDAHAPESATRIISTPASADVEELREALDARTTEATYMQEQMERADERAEGFRTRLDQAELSLEKANAIVLRARRRATSRTEQYSETIEAMSALHIRHDVLKGELEKSQSLASRHLLIGRLSGAAAIMAAILALISTL